MPERLLLTIGEVAALLHLGRSHTYKLVLSGQIASVKLGKNRRVLRSALDEYLRRLQQAGGAA